MKAVHRIRVKAKDGKHVWLEPGEPVSGLSKDAVADLLKSGAVVRAAPPAESKHPSETGSDQGENVSD